ncbi:MAG: PfkB family carbohydrate kinase [Candidatus Omnitrophica bacterium]|nr:PfkB family carbohydrate kinase [Candidatus Omnitrophota bacterium]
MSIEGVLLNDLGMDRLTGPDLREAIGRYGGLPDREKRRINREIAGDVIKTMGEACICAGKGSGTGSGKASLPGTRVLAVNHAGPLDVTMEWKTGPDGGLELVECCVDSGGDQVNVSKVFSHFGEYIALIALVGNNDGVITSEWKKNFLAGGIITEFIPFTGEDQQVQIYNIVDREHLPAMDGWADRIPAGVVEEINGKALDMLGEMSKGGSDNIWMLLSAGGPIRYDRELACYASLVRRVKGKYGDRVKFLIDFKHMSGPEEAMSVLEISRDTPQDIIKPNLEEFVQILVSSGLVPAGRTTKDTITEEEVRRYAVKLRERYGLLGVLVSMDRSGLMLVLTDRMIREKGININVACHTAAGDSLKAGFVYALSNGKSFEEAVHTGNLFGASTASMAGSRTVTPEKLAEIEVLARAQGVEPEVISIV